MPLRLISLVGLLAMIGLAWLMSTHKRTIPWRIILGGIGLQFVFAIIILRTRPGLLAFDALDTVFRELVGCVSAGAEFVFGEDYEEHNFAFKVLPTIIFFSAFMSIFYYYGIMQWIVGQIAKLMQKTLGTSGAETLSAAANIFVGQTEAPLVIRPYISSMTVSELNAVMVGGFATIAGGVLAAYVDMGIEPKHLLSASVISAPAALLIAKVMLPEVDMPKTLGTVRVAVEERASNVIEAITNGATSGLKLALNVGAMLIVFLALIAVVNLLLGWIGGLVGASYGNSINRLFGTEFRYNEWSLEMILGYLFAPIAWIMGIEWADCLKAGELLGLKMATNEFVAYCKLQELMQPGLEGAISHRSQTILTYALCGFANFSSIGIQIGGIGGIAPDRYGDLARLGFRAMLGGTLAAFMTACVAGMLI
ncbi:MAG: NupC/NupG family nucleoside CNT transporter [Pirellulales bacterium]|nr:NupC/NupG family nucleoside CNT transporter [Pirellulales bacterium]